MDVIKSCSRYPALVFPREKNIYTYFGEDLYDSYARSALQALITRTPVSEEMNIDTVCNLAWDISIAMMDIRRDVKDELKENSTKNQNNPT